MDKAAAIYINNQRNGLYENVQSKHAQTWKEAHIIINGQPCSRQE